MEVGWAAQATYHALRDAYMHTWIAMDSTVLEVASQSVRIMHAYTTEDHRVATAPPPLVTGKKLEPAAEGKMAAIKIARMPSSKCM